MEREPFYKFLQTRVAARMELLDKKGQAYAGNGDVFANFKRNAERLGLTPYQVWLVYFMKHIDAITNAVKTSPDQPVDKSEGLEGRIDDAINYLDLLAGMLAEVRPAAIPNNNQNRCARPLAIYTYYTAGELATNEVLWHEDDEYEAAPGQWVRCGNIRPVTPANTRFRRKLT